ESLIAVLSIVLACSASAVVNMVLPGYVRGALGGDSRTFGLLEGAWAVGGLAFLLMSLRGRVYLRRQEQLVTCGLGLTFVMLMVTSRVATALVVFLSMGGLFSLQRGLSNG